MLIDALDLPLPDAIFIIIEIHEFWIDFEALVFQTVDKRYVYAAAAGRTGSGIYGIDGIFTEYADLVARRGQREAGHRFRGRTPSRRRVCNILVFEQNISLFGDSEIMLVHGVKRFLLAFELGFENGTCPACLAADAPKEPALTARHIISATAKQTAMEIIFNKRFPETAFFIVLPP